MKSLVDAALTAVRMSGQGLAWAQGAAPTPFGDTYLVVDAPEAE